MKFFKVLLLYAVFCLGAVAAKNGYAAVSFSPPVSGFVPIQYAARVMKFEDERHMTNASGQLLVCQPMYKARGGTECTHPDDLRPNLRWTDVQDLKVPGYELSGVQFSPGSSSRVYLFVYFKKVNP